MQSRLLQGGRKSMRDRPFRSIEPQKDFPYRGRRSGRPRKGDPRLMTAPKTPSTLVGCGPHPANPHPDGFEG